jgi:hypothetical protein
LSSSFFLSSILSLHFLLSDFILPCFVNHFDYVRFEVSTVMSMRSPIFWDAIPCNLSYWSFGGTYCLHLQGLRVSQTVKQLTVTLPTTCSRVQISFRRPATLRFSWFLSVLPDRRLDSSSN